jgi:tetratricopeptide (TPR) repeat protein
MRGSVSRVVLWAFLRRAAAFFLVIMAGVTVPRRAVGVETEQERRDRSLALIKEGRSRYDLGKLDEAIKLFEQAYEVYPYPEALYNLGQAWRQRGDLKKAVFYYRSYLRNKPDAENRLQVEERIAELERLIQQQEQSKQKPPQGTEEPDRSSAAPRPGAISTEVGDESASAPSSSSPWYADTVAWTVTGIGALGLGVGTGFLIAADAKRDELKTASEFEKPSIRDEADKRERIGVVGLAGGGAVAFLGVVLLVRNPRPARENMVMSVGGGSFFLGLRVPFQAF